MTAQITRPAFAEQAIRDQLAKSGGLDAMRRAHLKWAVPEYEPSFTLDREVARARAEMGEKRWNELNAEWSDPVGIDPQLVEVK